MRSNSRLFTRVSAGAVAALLSVGLLVAGCSSSDNNKSSSAPTGGQSPTATVSAGNSADQQAVQGAIKGAVDAYNAGDANKFLQYWTDKGLQDEFGITAYELQANAQQFFQDSPPGGIRLGDFNAVSVNGDSATADFNFVFAKAISPQEYTLVKQGGNWKIDATKQLGASIPSNTTAIDVQMKEFAFLFDQSKIQNGDIAFKFTNAGDQAHEAVLLSVPPDFTVDKLLGAGGPNLPQGVDFVGFVDPLNPGESANMVFEKPLDKGTYMLVCFMPDTSQYNGPPHAAEGMAVRFNVPQ